MKIEKLLDACASYEDLEKTAKTLPPREELLFWLLAMGREFKISSDRISHLSVYIPKAALPALKYIASQRRMSVSRMIIKALIEYLEKEGPSQ